MKRSFFSRRGAGVALVLLVIAVAATAAWSRFGNTSNNASGPLLPVVLGLPTQLAGGSVLVARDQTMFAQNRIALTIRPFTLGKQALQAMIKGEADLAVVADTPFMYAVMKKENVQVLSSIYESRHTMALVARKDHGIASAADLAGKRVGTVLGINAQFFLDQLLLSEAVPRDSVTVVSLKPEQMVTSLEDGSVDATTIWDPELSAVRRKLGATVTTMYAEDIFIQRYVLVGKKSYIDAHPREVRSFLASLRDANAFIRSQPTRSQDIIGRALGMDPLLLADAFKPADFTLALNQPMLLALGDQARWAMRNALVPVGEVPNFLNHFATAPLEEVEPSAVKIIR